MTPEKLRDLEQRISRLETHDLGTFPIAFELPKWQLLLTLALGAGAAVTSYLAVGIPNHPFQWMFGIFVVALGLLRGWIPVPHKWYYAPLVALNLFCVSNLSKIFLGTGRRFPFFWMQFPNIDVHMPEGKFAVVPQFGINWLPTSLALWEVDFTRVQALLLLVFVFALYFRLDLLVSLSFFTLIVVSMPSLLSYSWDWLFPAGVLIILLFAFQASYQRPLAK